MRELGVALRQVVALVVQNQRADRLEERSVRRQAVLAVLCQCTVKDRSYHSSRLI